MTLSFGASERFWESDHISKDVEQILGAFIDVPCGAEDSDDFGRSVGWSVGRAVGQSIGRSVSVSVNRGIRRLVRWLCGRLVEVQIVSRKKS